MAQAVIARGRVEGLECTVGTNGLDHTGVFPGSKALLDSDDSLENGSKSGGIIEGSRSVQRREKNAN